MCIYWKKTFTYIDLRRNEILSWRWYISTSLSVYIVWVMGSLGFTQPKLRRRFVGYGTQCMLLQMLHMATIDPSMFLLGNRIWYRCCYPLCGAMNTNLYNKCHSVSVLSTWLKSGIKNLSGAYFMESKVVPLPNIVETATRIGLKRIKHCIKLVAFFPVCYSK